MQAQNVGQKLIGRAYRLPEKITSTQQSNLKVMMATLGDNTGFRPDGTLFVTEAAAGAVNAFSKAVGLNLQVIG